ncbi:MAG: cadmium-translocating P-type ATPase [Fimbriiglobus sp.]|nr:cadmium-translocating P-type ATPase [Fimbriiglobus sp.]
MNNTASEPNSLRWSVFIAVVTLVGIAVAMLLRWFQPELSWWLFRVADLPLLLVLISGGSVLVVGLLGNVFRGEFGADLLAGLSIVTATILGDYLAGALVVLMLSGGQALESFAVRRASSALAALARRLPTVAHRKTNGHIADVPLDSVAVGDTVVVFPHETCPVDGVVTDGHGTMDESYLTGEPFLLPKAPGSLVLSGAINGDAALSILAESRAEDSRHAKIMRVMRESEQRRPRLRRLGDQLGAWYTPVALAVAVVAWALSGNPTRFLAVLVVATPCPLLIAIPVAIIGAISVAARRSIVVKDPTVLETLPNCTVAIFDKTGTLTYGRPAVTEWLPLSNDPPADVLRWTASLERYSRHPLATAVVEAAEQHKLQLPEAKEVSERPGQGLTGVVEEKTIRVTGRPKLPPEMAKLLPPVAGGLECVVLVDGQLAAVGRFRDRPRDDGSAFIAHLGRRHGFTRILLVSGDRESEVRYLAEEVGITEIYAEQSPEQKVALVRQETAKANTVFVGDGINDAPALTAATTGLAFGQNSDVTAEAAGAVILDGTLKRVDELLHISRRLRRIALQSAVGGMALSIAAMGIAALGWLPPVAGAVTQELIDVLVVVNALRMSFTPQNLTDY